MQRIDPLIDTKNLDAKKPVEAGFFIDFSFCNLPKAHQTITLLLLSSSARLYTRLTNNSGDFLLHA